MCAYQIVMLGVRCRVTTCTQHVQSSSVTASGKKEHHAGEAGEEFWGEPHSRLQPPPP